MRPESRWNKNAKDPKDKRKRPSRPRSQRKAAQKKRDDDSGKSDAPASSPEGSNGTPASEQDGEENDPQDRRQSNGEDDREPELPPMPSGYRATSAEPSSRLKTLGSYQVDAIVRRVQSSPIRHEVAEDLNLTPKPLRRLLFSPDQGKAKALSEASGNIVRRSPRLNKSVDMFGNAKTPTTDKENVGTNQTNDDGLDHLFDNGENDELPHPQTPTPTRRSDRLLFKTPNDRQTPSKTPQKTPRIAFSPSAQRLLQTLKTPKGLPTNHPIATALLGDRPAGEEMTPFTFQIHQILSDTGNNFGSPLNSSSRYKRSRNPVTDSRGSHKSNQDNIFDFPDLPPLNNASTSSPSASAAAQAAMSSDNLPNIVDFSEFTNTNLHGGNMDDLMMIDEAELQELLSTDVIMPSSPPPTTSNPLQNPSGTGFFSWFDDDGGGNQNNHRSTDGMELWTELTNAAEGHEGHGGNAEGENGMRRVSPRKNKGHRNF